MSQFNSGRITKIKHPVGKFPDGRIKYQPAKYSILKWAPTLGGNIETFVMTEGTESKVSDITGYFGGEFGYVEDEDIIIEPHQADGSDSILGLHYIGDI